jgi:hypothetical protein
MARHRQQFRHMGLPHAAVDDIAALVLAVTGVDKAFLVLFVGGSVGEAIGGEIQILNGGPGNSVCGGGTGVSHGSCPLVLVRVRLGLRVARTKSVFLLRCENGQDSEVLCGGVEDAGLTAIAAADGYGN